MKDRAAQLALIGENVALAFETIRDRLFRSFLTVMGVFIGVVIIIGVAAVLNGFRQRAIKSFEAFGTNNITISKYPAIRMGRPDQSIRRRRDLSLDDAWAIRDECDAVAAVSPLRDTSSPSLTVKYRDREMMAPVLVGAFPALARIYNHGLREGRVGTEEENRRRVPICLIGVNVADSLFPSVSPLGKRLSIYGRRFRVVGVMAKFKDAPFGGENPYDSMIMISFYEFEEMRPWHRGMDIAVAAKPGRMQDALDQITDVLRRRRRVPWHAPNDFELNTSDSVIASFDQIIFATLAVMFTLSTVAFMVGGVGVMNVMFASVKERTREIGVRRAIGARRQDVMWQFLTETIVLTGSGGLLGVVVGELLMRGLGALFPELPVAVPMWARLFGLFGSAGVGLIFGLLPALGAARLDPIKALRYE